MADIQDLTGPIYHICRADEWENAQVSGYYDGSSQDQADGFIHFSGGDLVIESAAKHRAGQDGLILLEVDQAALGDDLKWEPARNDLLFPHLYGKLPVSSVIRFFPLRLDVDGKHIFPDDWGLAK